MEKSKTPQVSHPSQFSSTIFSVTLAICFVALIHVEIELHVHRQMLQVLNQEREDSIERRNIVGRHEKNIDSVLKMMQSGSPIKTKPVILSNFFARFASFGRVGKRKLMLFSTIPVGMAYQQNLRE